MVNLPVIGSISLTSLVWIFFFGIGFLMYRSWNIPITVLRFSGNKGRPTLIHKRGKKRSIKGVMHLWVKGYKTPIRDFYAENYYPSPKTKWGGLVLWEFEDGWLTPVIPKAVRKDKARMKQVEEAFKLLRQNHVVGFDYDEFLHRDLQFKIVDDVDAEFAVTELMRQDSQYSGGLMDWLNRHSTAVMAVFIVVCVLVGFIMWMREMPDMMATCAGAAKDVVKQSLLESAAEGIAPPG